MNVAAAERGPNTMNTTTRTLSDDARMVLDDLGITVASDDPDILAAPDYVCLSDQHAGLYARPYSIAAVEAACEAVESPDDFAGDEDQSASARRFEAFHDVLAEGPTPLTEPTEEMMVEAIAARLGHSEARIPGLEVYWDEQSVDNPGMAWRYVVGSRHEESGPCDVVVEIRLPDEFYRTRTTVGGGETVDYSAPNVDPQGEATAYVSDGARFGVRYPDGNIDWLGDDPERAFGEGAEVLEVVR